MAIGGLIKDIVACVLTYIGIPFGFYYEVSAGYVETNGINLTRYPGLTMFGSKILDLSSFVPADLLLPASILCAIMLNYIILSIVLHTLK
jgi:hypothetical protein